MKIIYANCAGAARDEQNDPRALGRTLSARFDGLHDVAVIGLSEIVISEPPRIDDLSDFRDGTGRQPAKSCFFPHLDSGIHDHPEAMHRKWIGQNASPRIAAAINNDARIQQGNAALLFSPAENCEPQLIRPSGYYPFDTFRDAPQRYKGTRDTEPRIVVLIRGLETSFGQQIDLVFCQLETSMNDLRTASRQAMLHATGTRNRIRQLDAICSFLGNERPAIIMGDFNCRPGSPELNYLCRSYHFRQVLPAGLPALSVSKGSWGKKHAWGRPAVQAPDLTIPEKEQGWPWSHLQHHILIDHAFVRGLSPLYWNLKLEIVPLPIESPGRRYSDHRPIVLSMSPLNN